MLDNGKLIVNVYGTSMGKPLEGAVVRVSKNNGNTVLEEMITDNSGNSATLSLSCPPRDYSIEYNANMPKPYAQYNLEISSFGFKSQRILGVEILEGTTAIQNIILAPNNGRNNRLQTKTIMIGEHTLYGDFPSKIPENDIKPLPLPSGEIVLDTTVIPETIVVHAGFPDNRLAPNYYVPFKDYIKNVASCEVYPTWPSATIRANVLAIISFTLNRVFTEWYRGQGKDFTITSSTAYDHAFTYGRNNFQEISVIVDEMFTTYITKPNIHQPLFTQYCDGKKVSCPGWMTQWGSKDLGDKGYGHIEILKNYYGYNIYLDQATKVSGIPSSFPGYNLQIGSTGDSVRIIQNQLNTISNNYPAIPKLVADGIFGSRMADSVRMFQKIFSLSQDGIVGLATWYKISAIYVAVMKLAELV